MLNDTVKELKERSQKRKKLLAQTFGVSNVNELRQALGTYEDGPEKKKAKVLPSVVIEEKIKEEEKSDCGVVYKDSSTFLKGTQSSNPHNDYCQHFVDTGQRPQNFIRDVGLADRFEEYPKLRELIKLKKEEMERNKNGFNRKRNYSFNEINPELPKRLRYSQTNREERVSYLLDWSAY